MSKFKELFPSILFNLIETLIIILCGIMLEIDKCHLLVILLAFFIVRLSVGQAMHYKKWQWCLLWSTLIFLSLFVVAKAGLVLSLILAGFCALTLSGNANINNLYQWKPPGQSKYQKELDFIKYNPANAELIAFENRLKEREDKLTYLCYKYIFKDRMTWAEASERLDIESNRLTPIIDKIALALRCSCDI